MTKRKPKAAHKPNGRPRSTMTADTEERILGTVRLGLWPDRACAAHGVSDKAMRAHRARHPEFAARLEAAEAEAEKNFWSRMVLHSSKSYQACAWMLEKRWADRYGRKSGADDISVHVDGKVESVGPTAPTETQALASYAAAFSAAAAAMQAVQQAKMQATQAAE